MRNPFKPRTINDSAYIFAFSIGRLHVRMFHWSWSRARFHVGQRSLALPLTKFLDLYFLIKE